MLNPVLQSWKIKSVFLQTLILNSLTGQILKPALILAKTLTSDPYNGGLLKRRRSVYQDLYKSLAGSDPKDFVLSYSFARKFWLSPRKNLGTIIKTHRVIDKIKQSIIPCSIQVS